MASGSHTGGAATSGRRLKDSPGIAPADRWYRAPVLENMICFGPER